MNVLLNKTKLSISILTLYCDLLIKVKKKKDKIKTPRSSIDYLNYGKQIEFDSCIAGDIIVFTGTNAKNRNPGHVGIIVSKPGEELQFIHSSSNKKNGGVKLSTFTESPYYKVRFLKIVRISQTH